MARAERSGSFLRRPLACVLLATYAFVAAGVPLPAVRNPSRSDELYPCSSCACGCASADQCWRSCCCHTLAQRLAWAAKNGVKPPDFALAEARRTGLDETGRPLTKVVNVSLATKDKSCCSSKRSCCASRKSCCSSRGSSHDCEHERESQESSGSIVAWRALACHGQSLQWLAAVPSLIAVELELADQLPLAVWLGPPSSECAESISTAPTPPPPERA